MDSPLRKGCVFSMVSPVGRMEIYQIAPAIAGSLQFSAQARLPFKEQHLHIGIFRCCQCCRHTGSAAANNSDDHTFTCFLPAIIPEMQPGHKKNLLAMWKSYGIIP